MKLTLITGNTHKLAEWQRLAGGRFELTAHAIDLPEIQSLDQQEIVHYKLREAYKQLGEPVVVEDVSAGLDKLQGLPGPFVKFFNERLGNNALVVLGGDGAAATATCVVGYFDGDRELFGVGTVHGQVFANRPSESSFGFDGCFQPDGSVQTFGEMSGAQKDAISHRRLAIDDLAGQLAQLEQL